MEHDTIVQITELLGDSFLHRKVVVMLRHGHRFLQDVELPLYLWTILWILEDISA